jgi:hypothetical protein
MDTSTFLSGFDALTGGQTLAEILHKVIVLLDDEDNWCQGVRATDGKVIKVHGEEDKLHIVKANDPNAVAVSINGAIGRVSNEFGITPPFILDWLDRLVLEFVNDEDKTKGVHNLHDLDWFNDTYTHEVIMNFLHEAYRRAS